MGGNFKREVLWANYTAVVVFNDNPLSRRVNNLFSVLEEFEFSLEGYARDPIVKGAER